MASPLLKLLRQALIAAAEPHRAAGMQAYMKSTMPYHGVTAPSLRKVCKSIFKEHDIASGTSWQRDVLSLWRGAEFREERHAAIELAGDRRAATFQTPTIIPMYEEMVVEGAWWDYVDSVAIHRIGPILRGHPGPLKKILTRWSTGDDLWKRRSAIISQVSFKDKTDLEFLYSVIEPNLGSTEFFLRKAIGWALRQYAWVDADEIRRYVNRNEARLSPLSRREAMINIEGRRKGSGKKMLTARGPRPR